MDLNFSLQSLISIALGVVLIIFGRRIFWLLIGAAGFVAGIIAFNWIFPDQQGWTGVLTALVVGFASAGLSFFLQKSALWLVGFFAGICIAGILVNTFSPDLGNLAWLVCLVGGAAGAALTAVLFEWALMILSSLGGAVLIINALGLQHPLTPALLMILMIIGVVLQSRKKKRD